MQLYIVCYTDEDGDNQDQFITASTPEEAFEMWRGNMEIDPDHYANEDREAMVYEVPAPASTPTVHTWGDATGAHFNLSYDSLATRAVRAEREAPQYRTVHPDGSITEGLPTTVVDEGG